MKLSKIIIALLLIYISLAVGAAGEEKRINVVVYNLEGQNGFSQSTATLMSSAVVDMLVMSPKLQVSDEKSVEKVMAEVRKAQSGMTCDKTEEVCRIDNAKIMKADWIVLGNIGLLEDKNYVVRIRVVDINATPKYAQKEMCCACSNEQLMNLIEKMAQNIVTFFESGKAPKTVPTTSCSTKEPQSSNKGIISVNSTPQGAEVLLDGTPVGSTPITLDNIAPGAHQITIKMLGFMIVGKSVEIRSGPNAAIEETLEEDRGGGAGKGQLVVKVTPSNAEALIDAKDKYSSPNGVVSIPPLDEGRHIVTVSAKGFASQTKTVEIKANEKIEITIILGNTTGAIRVVTDPPGADVSLIGQLKGKTLPKDGLLISGLYPGKYQISIDKPGYSRLVKNVDVTAGKTLEINEALAELTGDVLVTTAPVGASVYLDNNFIGKTTAQGLPIKTIVVGKHTVAVKNPPDYKDYTAEVIVKENDTARVTAYLDGYPGTIVVTCSIPEDADVYIDGKYVGKTPYNGEISAGSHTVKLSKDGFEDHSESAPISPRKAYAVTVEKLEKRMAPKDMVSVPAGDFMMGCNSSVDTECQADEKPYHKVYLDGYYIDKYEVTNDQYQTCVQAGRCTAAHFDDGSCYVYDGKSWKQGTLPQSFRGGNQPVVCIDWSEAKAFCEYAGKRLPTEAEWEKAARGTDGRKFPWGNQPASCSYAVMNEGGNGCGRNSTWPVGSKPSGASPYGAMDMAGNVWEWVSDWYGDKYYSSSASSSPKGTDSGSYRVLRGGSWRNLSSDLRASARRRNSPSRRNVNDGFRCGRTY